MIALFYFLFLFLLLSLLIRAVSLLAYACVHPVLAVYRFILFVTRALLIFLGAAFLLHIVGTFIKPEAPPPWWQTSAFGAAWIVVGLVRAYWIAPVLEDALAFGGIRNARRARNHAAAVADRL